MADHPRVMAGRVVGAHGAIAHTDDPRQYHALPSASGSRLPSGAVVPRADSEGVSLGLRPGTPSVLSVEPTDRATGEGGLAVDLGLVTPEAAQDAYARAAAEAGDEEERVMLAYKYLNQAAAAVAAQKQGESEVPIPPPASQPRPTPQVEAAPPQPVSNESYAPQPAVQQYRSSQLEQQLSQLSDVVAALAQEQLRQQEAKTTLPPPEPEVIPEPEPVPANMISEEEFNARLDKAFATLNIPGLAHEPAKPPHKIVFDLGEGGKLSSWYHWVNEHEDGLFLIYDNRFEYGTVFEPPNLGNKRVIKVVHSNSQKEWEVYSLGFVQPFGVFTIINLVIASTADQPQMVNYGHGATEYET